jgi:hypothetical protein
MTVITVIVLVICVKDMKTKLDPDTVPMQIRNQTLVTTIRRCWVQFCGSGIWCLFDPRIRDPGWVKCQDPGSGSGMNNPDHIS